MISRASALQAANAAGTPGDLGGQVCAISANGQQVLMTRASGNLLPGDGNFRDDLFLKHLAAGDTNAEPDVLLQDPAGCPGCAVAPVRQAARSWLGCSCRVCMPDAQAVARCG